VEIVPAGVHHGHIAPGIVFSANFAGIKKVRSSLPPAAHQVRAQHHGRSRAVFQDGDNPRTTDVFSHVVSQAAQAPSQLRRGLDFVCREFRILMQIEIQRGARRDRRPRSSFEVEVWAQPEATKDASSNMFCQLHRFTDHSWPGPGCNWLPEIFGLPRVPKAATRQKLTFSNPVLHRASGCTIVVRKHWFASFVCS